MKLYLSSHLIPSTAELIKLLGKPLSQTSMLLIGNAQDYYSEHVRDRIVGEVESHMIGLGMRVKRLDLREYSDLAKLKKECASYDLIWVMDGNSYVLRYEMHRSGFDRAIKEVLRRGVVYGAMERARWLQGSRLMVLS